MAWRGNKLQWTGFLVCTFTCLDLPNQQLRPRILPPDPIPVVNPRIEHYYQDDGAVPYAGPGDVVTGATAWYGLRGYDNATATLGTTKAVRLRRPSDNTEKDIVILTSGFFDWPTAWNFCSGGPVYVVTFYDQTGNGFDVTQSVQENQPELLFNEIGDGQSAIYFGGNEWLVGTTIPTPVTDATIISVVNGGNPSGSFQNFIGGAQSNGADLTLFFASRGGNGNTVSMGSTTGFEAPANPNVWHSVIGASFTASNAILDVDGVATAGDIEPPTLLSPITLGGFETGGGDPLTHFVGFLAEGGIWPSGFTGAQAAALANNQSNFWTLGFTASAPGTTDLLTETGWPILTETGQPIMVEG